MMQMQPRKQQPTSSSSNTLTVMPSLAAAVPQDALLDLSRASLATSLLLLGLLAASLRRHRAGCTEVEMAGVLLPAAPVLLGAAAVVVVAGLLLRVLVLLVVVQMACLQEALGTGCVSQRSCCGALARSCRHVSSFCIS
jgi:uncharacterized membrane protein